MVAEVAKTFGQSAGETLSEFRSRATHDAERRATLLSG